MEIDVLQVLDEMDSFRRKCYDKPDAECPTDWALRVAEAILAKAAGYSGRTAWTGDLKQNSASQYAQDLENSGLSVIILEVIGMINKTTALELREAAQATCGNSFLMDNGKILTKEQYKKLGFAERLGLVAYYQYSTGQVVKI